MGQPEGPTTPDELSAALSELKARAGLSLAALATRTPYSKSAWHRYLTGTQRPPRSAVEALARLAGVDPGPALARWEASEVPPSASTPAESGSERRSRLRRLRLPLLFLLTAAAVTAAAFTLSGRRTASDAPVVASSPRCHGSS